ncbi:hypothetical protein V6N13_021015 [Hibiscus sabdariffa]|uniref:Uncharacterized protein n=1 Tax=Hibiscus sabdariffa TaxID=183260 RepID=A0ABR2EV90_9ROSI
MEVSNSKEVEKVVGMPALHTVDVEQVSLRTLDDLRCMGLAQDQVVGTHSSPILVNIGKNKSPWTASVDVQNCPQTKSCGAVILTEQVASEDSEMLKKGMEDFNSGVGCESEAKVRWLQKGF